MAKTGSELYRGYTLTLPEKRDAATRLAASRNISYKSAMRAIQRAVTTTGVQRTPTPKDLKRIIPKVTIETRSTPDAASPRKIKGFVWYWTRSGEDFEGEEIPDGRAVKIVDVGTFTLDDGIAFARLWLPTGREGSQFEDGGTAFIMRITVQYSPPRTFRKIVQKRTKTKPRVTELMEEGEEYRIRVYAKFTSEVSSRASCANTTIEPA